MTHTHRPPREEPTSPLVDEPGTLPVEPDEGPVPVAPGELPIEGDAERAPDIPH